MSPRKDNLIHIRPDSCIEILLYTRDREILTIAEVKSLLASNLFAASCMTYITVWKTLQFLNSFSVILRSKVYGVLSVSTSFQRA